MNLTSDFPARRWHRRCSGWIGLVLLMTTSLLSPLSAEPPPPSWPVPQSAPLQRLLDRAVARVLVDFQGRGLSSNQLAATLVDLTESGHPEMASHRGDELIYPASVVKLFYLVAAHQWMQDGRLDDTPELRRALRDMIVESYNEATHYVVDLLTGTTSGPELADDSLRAWVDQRNAVNRYFASLGYTRINVNKKPWGEGPYGRETQAIARFDPKRNWLTTDATARLMTSVATGTAVSAERSRQMLELMTRDIYGPVKDPEDQTHGFTGIALLKPRVDGARIWSKAGWTSQTRHDAAYLELADGRKFVCVVFTTDHAGERDIIPALARVIIEGLRR
ncbi:MAG: hypothetical protein RIS76_1636 [Verrucomicrobiota bacterium]